MTRLKSALTAAALSALLSFGAYAGDAGVTPEQIAAAADHEAIAAARCAGRRHARSRCEAHYSAAATENRELAKEPRAMEKPQ